jgi:hypothetical protein
MTIKANEINATDYRGIFNEIQTKCPNLDEADQMAAAKKIFEEDEDYTVCNDLSAMYMVVTTGSVGSKDYWLEAISEEELEESGCETKEDHFEDMVAAGDIVEVEKGFEGTWVEKI